MIDRIIAFSIRRRGLVILASLALARARAGWRSGETPVDAIPDLSEDGVIVFADWPGHGPREVEDQVTYPLALGLQGVRGVRSVRSSSDFHYSHDPRDPRRVGRPWPRGVGGSPSGWRGPAPDLPPGVTPRLGPDSPATGQIYWYTVEGKGLDPGRLRSIQDWYVKPRLASVAGVAEVASVGGFPVEYQVSVVPLPAPGPRGDASRRSWRRSRGRTRRSAATRSRRGTPNTWSGGSAGSGPRPRGATRPRRSSATWKRSWCRGRAARPSGWATWRRSPSGPGLAGGSWRRTAARRSAAWS